MLEKLKKDYPSIEFTGWKSSEEVKEYMRKAKALIFPSKLYETMGMTVIEAQNVGIPVIVNKKTAASEFMIKKNGYIYDNIEELNKILKFNYIEKLGKISIDYGNDYIYKLIECFNKILGG